MKILLACSAGMSTSLLEKSMNTYLEENNIKGEVKAMSSGDAKQVMDKWDIVMLGPQVRFMLPGFKEATDKPVIVIDQSAYAMAKAEIVVKQAQEALKNKN